MMTTTTNGKAKRMTDKRRGTAKTTRTKPRRLDRDWLGFTTNDNGLKRTAYGEGTWQQRLFERGYPPNTTADCIRNLGHGQRTTIGAHLAGLYEDDGDRTAA